METSPSWETNRFSASQEISRTLWNAKVHYPFYKCHARVPILSQVNPHFLKSILILFSHLCLVLPSDPFPQVFQPKPFMHLSSLSYVLHVYITRIFGEEYRSLSSSLCILIHSCYLVPLRPKYSSQHPILKHPDPPFLPQCERPSFTPIRNNRQNYTLYARSESYFFKLLWPRRQRMTFTKEHDKT